MAQSLRRACVVGAGLAGLCCAMAAASRGWRVQVLDDAPHPRSLPAHIEVVPSMLRDLAAFGVADDCVRTGFAYHGIDVIDRQGQHLHQLPTQRLAGARYPAALGIRHADLHRLLEQAATRLGVAIRRDARAVAIRERAGRSEVILHSGETVESDLAMLAVGAGSALSKSIFPQARPADEIGQAWWYTLLRRPADLDRPLIAYGAAGRRAVLVPVRNDLAGLALTEPTEPVEGKTAPAGRLSDALASFAPRLRSLASQLDQDTPITQRPARCGLLDSPWHHGAVLAVGDCVHALPPHFGQAAAQAVEDARVLADLLDGSSDRAGIFDAFQRRRAERVRLVYDITTTAARWDLRPDKAADLSLLMQRLAAVVEQPA
jgi:2-polyprenyl-6-methoxyphenol hydroxylase-like FAD-dependent oxidoreductase